MAFEGFLSLGGTEIANASRTKAYADELVPMLGLSDCWDCADLAEVLGDDPYTTPIIDRPDWFTDHDPDSGDFCGFYPLEIEGIDDGVREATVTELSLDGAVVGAPRYKSREIRVSGLLIGVTPAAVTYGLTWLAKALEGAPCRDADGCTGDHLCFYSACPPMCSDSPALDAWPGPDEVVPMHHESQFYLCDGGLITTWQRACSVDYERTLYQVSLTSGPTIVERYNSHCGSMVRVEFTLVAGVPFAFSTAVSAVPGLEPIPDPQVMPEVACTPGTDVVVRTNLATNPVPVGNAAATGKGWLADGSAFTATVDTTVTRIEGGSSVRVQRNTLADSPNLAPNPQPTGTLDGWSWRLGSSSIGPSRTNLIENPWPRLADGWTYDVPGGGPGTIEHTNLMPNPSVETNTAYYSTNTANTAITQDTTWSASGTASLKVTPVGTSLDTSAGLTAAVYTTLQAGTTYTITATCHLAAPQTGTPAASARRIRAYWTDGPTTWSEQAPNAAGDYTLSVTFTPTAAMTGIRLFNGAALGAGGEENAVWWDNVTIVEGTEAVQFNGDTPDTDDAAYSWTGTPHASTSIQQAMDSPAFTGPMDVITDDAGPDGELGFVRHTQAVADAQTWTVSYSGDQVLTAGVTYTVSAYFRSTSARQVQFVGRTFDVPGYGWVRLTGQYVGSGTVPTLTITGTGQAAGEVIDVARALAEEGTILGTYFDGSTPTSGGYTYAWTGDEDASTSTSTLNPVEATTVLATGTGPGSQTTFQRTTIVAPKAGGEDGPVYSMALGEGLYTLAMQVRPSVAVNAYMRVSALDASGVVLTSTSSAAQALTADAWQRMLPVRISAPANTVRLQVAVLMPGDVVLPADETFDAGAVQVVDGLFLTDPVIARATYLGQHDNAKSTIDVVGGGTYTASVYAGANVAALATVSINFYTSTGLPAGGVTRGLGVELDAWTTPIGVAEWHRPYVTATAPANAVGAVVNIEVRKLLSGAQLGDATWLTCVLFEQAGALLSYFDGSSQDAGDISYTWTGTANASTSQTLLAIPAPVGSIVDPDCPVVPPPPRPPVIDVSCVDTPSTWRRYVVDVGADLVPDWRDTVPIVRLQSHDTAVRQVRIRFYPNPLEAPLQALNPCDYCGEFVVTYIPPRSVMTIDGIRQWASITDDQTGTVFTANHLLASSDGGPVSWPILSCGVPYTLVVDVSPTEVADLTPQVCLAARS